MIKLACTHCSQPLEAEDESLGLKTNCPACGQELTVTPAKPPEPAPLLRAVESQPGPALPPKPMPSYVRKSQANESKLPTNKPGHCRSCSAPLPAGSVFCPSCGAASGQNGPTAQNPSGKSFPQSTVTDADDLVYPPNPPRSPSVAWLSILAPGISQIVLGQTWKGVWMVLATNFLNGLNTWAIISEESDGLSIYGIMGVVLIVASIIDAQMVAGLQLRGLTVKKWAFFPTGR